MRPEQIKGGKSCHVAVGSENEAKVAAVQEAFGLVYESPLVSPVWIDGTQQQPLDDKQTFLGAQQRAEAVRLAIPDASYWVGIEGGVEPIGDELMVIAWVVIINLAGTGCSRSASYQLPKSAAAALRSGSVMGDISEKVAGGDWRSRGLVSNLSLGLITRTSLYVQPVILALLPLLDPWKNI